jgi:hypothetical protein
VVAGTLEGIADRKRTHCHCCTAGVISLFGGFGEPHPHQWRMYPNPSSAATGVCYLSQDFAPVTIDGFKKLFASILNRN